MSNKTNSDSEIQGFTRLITDAVLGITDVVETVQKQIVYPGFLQATSIQYMIDKIAGITFNNIRWGTQTIGEGLSQLLGQLIPLLGDIEASNGDAVRSILNGIFGDYLEEKENPLSIDMQFRYDSKAIALNKKSIQELYPAINGKILLMVHGLCMNDIQWTREGHNHGTTLAKELGKTPIYLHYNSGRHVSSNGQSLNELLERLVLNWPVPVEEIVIVAHSIGGLVTRSAFYYGSHKAKNWTKYLKNIVFLGTPHHGAALERAGNYVDVILESIYQAKPFARLGKARSAGITDLRYGNLIDEDWQGKDRFEMQEDQRSNIPLPKSAESYSIAAALGKASQEIASHMLGDGLVDIKSALGQHVSPQKNLQFKEENTWITYEDSHLDLLSSLEVYHKLKEWLS